MAGKTVRHAEIILLTDHPLQNSLGSIRFYCHADTRASLQKGGNDIRQMAGRKSWKTGNADMAGAAFIDILADIRNLAHQFQHPPDIRLQKPHFLRGKKLPLATIKK